MVKKNELTLDFLPDVLAVCRLSPSEPFPGWASKSRFWSITRGLDEVSVVCAERDVPEGIKCEKAWSCFKVRGPLDFALTGILASIANVLAENGVSLFAVSTFDTDYILIKSENIEKAKSALRTAGHSVN